MAVAVHDRMSRNGVGCTAGHGRLSALVGCHLKSLSRSLRMLAECGYVGGRSNPLNPRARAYFVIYTEFDAAFLKAVKGNQPVTLPAPIGNKVIPISAAMGNQLWKNGQQIQQDASYNIFSEAVRYPVETGERNSVETAALARSAPKKGNELNVGAYLAIAERDWKAGRLDMGHVRSLYAYLDNLTADGGLEHGDPLHGRAYRLLEELGAAIDAEPFPTEAAR